MKYRVIPGTDRKVSALGMGCMRLPTLETEGHPIDYPEAIRIVRHAIDSGLRDTEVGELLRDTYGFSQLINIINTPLGGFVIILSRFTTKCHSHLCITLQVGRTVEFHDTWQEDGI